MSIILAEEIAGSPSPPERSFDQHVVRIGRDARECEIVLDGAKFPMVSRKHAEIQRNDGDWYLVDLNSSYGTFVDGLRISAPQKLAVGARLQFGENGPVLRVVWFEITIDPASYRPRENDPVDPFRNIQAGVPGEASLSATAAGLGRLELLDRPGAPPYVIEKNSIWLGRELGCDIVFDASAVTVSRRHAEIRQENGEVLLEDNRSFNGTLVNDQRISAPVPIYHNDQIRLGVGGPVLRFSLPTRPAPEGSSLAGQRSIAIGQLANLMQSGQIGSKTVSLKMDRSQTYTPDRNKAEPQLLMSLSFGEKRDLTIGRDESNDIKLDGLQISNRHARILTSGAGVVIEDLNSTNGVYINGTRVSREAITPNDAVQIGTFLIRIDNANNIGVFDTRSKTRIDAVNITKDVRNRAGGGMLRLLDNVSLSIQPNEFVGLLGPSGAGKSTLMDAMNGMRPAGGGSVLINNLDLYRHLDSLKQSIGYVPQDDIIHRELTIYRTLYYVAKLRLSRDVSSSEIDQIINEVLDVTGLAERRNVPISQLSGGQRKRVSIAVELITKPSIIFLDEPTSGLDPATEEKIMKLFRQIAESGRTVILTTHAMENVKLFDKIVVLMQGKLVFYGRPDEALSHLQAGSFKELYDKLEEPVEQKVRQHGEAHRKQITEQTAEEWKQKFAGTPQYRKNVHEPLKQLGQLQSKGVQKSHGLGIAGALRQWMILSRRYFEVLFKDKLTLFILFAQAPIIALLTFFVMGANQPRDFVYFITALVAVWFGTSVSAREIIREQPVYKRERMVNLGLLPYLASKLFILGIIVGVQCLLLFVPLKLLDLVGLMPMPGVLLGIPQAAVMLLTAAVGIALGLLISSLVRTSEMATSLVPLILIPQILFSGLIGVPSGINKVAGLFMPAAWSFDSMKRFSALDTLEKEGADPRGKTNGQGLYKSIETENDRIIRDAKRELDEYKENSEDKLREFEDDLKVGGNPEMPKLDDPPRIADARKVPEDLSGYVSFLHPWMNVVLNQIVLMLMFSILVIAALIALRLQDRG